MKITRCYLVGELNSSLLKEVLEIIFTCDKGPLYFIINSTGGEASFVLPVLKAMKTRPDVKFIGYCLGQAMSAAAEILLNCDERWAEDGSLLMVHSPRFYYNYTSSHDMTQEMSLVNKQDELIWDRLKHRPLLDRIQGGETVYFSAQEAKKACFIDEIGCPMLNEEGQRNE